jgi:hypothetical protein
MPVASRLIHPSWCEAVDRNFSLPDRIPDNSMASWIRIFQASPECHFWSGRKPLILNLYFVSVTFGPPFVIVEDMAIALTATRALDHVFLTVEPFVDLAVRVCAGWRCSEPRTADRERHYQQQPFHLLATCYPPTASLVRSETMRNADARSPNLGRNNAGNLCKYWPSRNRDTASGSSRRPCAKTGVYSNRMTFVQRMLQQHDRSPRTEARYVVMLHHMSRG